MQLDEKSVRRIIDEVWGLVADASTEACLHEATVGERVLVSSVDVSGPWEGAVAVRCSLSLARLIADRAHGLNGAEPTDAQIHFAVGAIARLIGVNVKFLLAAPARVSPPVIVEARGADLEASESSRPASTTWLSSLGYPFSVTVSLRARAA